MMNESMNE